MKKAREKQERWKKERREVEREERKEEKEEREREREREREIKRDNFLRYNLILGIISYYKIHDRNALYEYSHVNKGI